MTNTCSNCGLNPCVCGLCLGVGVGTATCITEPNHYDCKYNGIKLDPYRIFTTYSIAHPAQQHAIKKLLRAGRSIKSLEDDIKESIGTLERWLDMIEEDKLNS